jgi:hypothetical protein
MGRKILTDRWNIVVEKTTAGTVSQEAVDKQRKWLEETDQRDGIWYLDIDINSSDEDIAKFLFLSGEVLESSDIDMEIVECDKI